MDPEHVEAVVEPQPVLQRADEAVADEACRERRAAIAPTGPLAPAAGVTATSPATAPDAPPSIDGLPETSRSSPIHAEQSGGRRNQRVDHRHRGQPVGLERRAGVEPEPADPQQPRADHRQRQRVRRHGFLQMTDPRAGEGDPDQAGDAGIDMDHGPAREIDRAKLEQQSVRTTHTMWASGA